MKNKKIAKIPSDQQDEVHKLNQIQILLFPCLHMQAHAESGLATLLCCSTSPT